MSRRFPTDVKYQIESTAQTRAIVAAIARDVPRLADRITLLAQEKTIADGPTQMKEADNARLKSENGFCPMGVGLEIAEMVGRGGSPNRVNNVGAVKVVLVGRKTIAQATEDAVAREAVLVEIIVKADAKVGGIGLVVQVGGFVGVVATAPPHLGYREVTLLEIETRSCLVRTKGTGNGHHGADHIHRNGDPGKRADLCLLHGCGSGLARLVLYATHAVVLLRRQAISSGRTLGQQRQREASEQCYAGKS